ncbi:MAG: hypothetical protein ACXWC8_12170, partial [Limisphaerales bacterium]
PTNATVWDMYNWDDVNPCRDGKLWVWARLGTDTHEYLYDLNTKLIVGELLNGGAVSFNQDGTKLLCTTSAEAVTFSERLVQRLNELVAKARHLPPPKPSFRYESVWLVNLRINTAKHVGVLKQYYGSGSSWRPSPSFRFVCNQTSTQSGLKKFFVFDFDTETIKEMPCPKYPLGWWDDRTVLMSDNDDVNGFNALTGVTTNLLSSANIEAFLGTNGVTNVKKPTIFIAWNKEHYDFYVSSAHRYDSNAAFLAQIDRSGPSLKMVNRAFEFHWMGQFSPDKTLYLYSGESGKWGSGGNGSVLLRDVRDNSTRVLVPSDRSKQYSLCRFYEGGVIYSRNRHLWRIDLNGSNNVPLFSGNGY